MGSNDFEGSNGGPLPKRQATPGPWVVIGPVPTGATEPGVPKTFDDPDVYTIRAQPAPFMRGFTMTIAEVYGKEEAEMIAQAPAMLELLRQVWSAAGERLDNEKPPLKYTAPYGALAKIGEFLFRQKLNASHSRAIAATSGVTPNTSSPIGLADEEVEALAAVIFRASCEFIGGGESAGIDDHDRAMARAVLTHLRAQRKASDVGDVDLREDAISLVRRIAHDGLGGNCAFVDDDMKVIVGLAQRAVLAGLHSDCHAGTRQHFETASEKHRAAHEAALGRPILQTCAAGSVPEAKWVIEEAIRLHDIDRQMFVPTPTGVAWRDRAVALLAELHRESQTVGGESDAYASSVKTSQAIASGDEGAA
jgi:hypothetical protein